MKNNYISLFKIDGIPILPPLMTIEKFIDCKNDKRKAIAIEKRHKLSNVTTQFHLINVESPCKESINIDDDFQLKNSHKKKLEKSDTLIYDVLSNTVIIPNEKLNNCKINVPLNLKENSLQTVEKPNQLKYDITDNITNLSKLKLDNLEETTNKKSVDTSEVSTLKNVPYLIRSNSFTLEGPSEVLKNNMNQKKKLTMNVKKIEQNKYISEHTWKKKSPYDSKLSVKNANQKKHKSSCLKINKPSLRKEFNNSLILYNNEHCNKKEMKQLFEQFEENRRVKINNLFEKHEEEKEKLEEIFQNENKFLLDLFENCAGKQKLFNKDH